MEVERDPHKIKLIVAESKDFYSYMIIENGEWVPLPNQVLICHHETRTQEL
jgi:hypothetical protein